MSAVRRVADGMRCCTVHVPLDDHRELSMLALEDSTAAASLTYADELRIAIREYIQRRRSSAPQPKRQALDAGVADSDGHGGGRLLAAPFFVHFEPARGLTTPCNLRVMDLDPERLTTQAANADCPKCCSVLDSNAAAMTKPTRTRKPKPAKKGTKRR